MKRNTALNDKEQEYMHLLFEWYARLLQTLAMKYSANLEEQNDLIQDTLASCSDME